MAAIGLGNISKYIQRFNNQTTHLKHFVKRARPCIDSLRDWLAAPMPKRPRCNRRASILACHPSPHVAPTFTQAAGTVGYACPHYVNNSVVTERSEVLRGRLGKHHHRDHGLWVHVCFTFLPFISIQFMILLPVFRLVRSCVNGFLPFASFLMKFPFARCIALALFYWNF